MKNLVFMLCVVAAALLPAARVAADEAASSQEPTLVYELRTYTTPADKLPELHERFRNHTLDLFAKHGMTNVIYWTPTDRPNTLVYLLAHESEAAGKASFAAFRADPIWQAAKAKTEAAGSLTTEVESVYLRPLDFGGQGTFAELMAEKPGYLYEMRTYTAAPGKLADLHARFRDHTCRLFEKHGIVNLAYAAPTDPETAETTLIYFVAHPDQAAADKAWQAFAQDPEWQAARTASEQAGKLLAAGGVQRIYLKTTDYSPVK